MIRVFLLRRGHVGSDDERPAKDRIARSRRPRSVSEHFDRRALVSTGARHHRAPRRDNVPNRKSTVRPSSPPASIASGKPATGWTMARDLKPGDRLRMIDGIATVQSIKPDARPECLQPQRRREPQLSDRRAPGSGSRRQLSFVPVSEPFDRQANPAPRAGLKIIPCAARSRRNPLPHDASPLISSHA